jgi:hypothetical protein
LIDIDFSSSHIQHLIKVISNDLKTGIYQPTNDQLFIDQVLKLKETLLNGDFYTVIANEYSTQHKKQYTREQAKLNVMFWLTGSYLNRMFIQYMRKKYDQITHYIDYINANYSEGVKTVFYKKIPKKNGMVIKLMQSESFLVNDLIMNEVANKHPDTICYGIFDGFLVEQKYSDTLIEIINQKGKEYLKFIPKIKVSSDALAPSVTPKRKTCTEERVNTGADIMSMPTTVFDLDQYFNRFSHSDITRMPTTLGA